MDALKLLQPEQQKSEQQYFGNQLSSLQQPSITKSLGQWGATGLTGALGALADLPYNIVNFVPNLMQKGLLNIGEYGAEKLGYNVPNGKEREKFNENIYKTTRNAAMLRRPDDTGNSVPLMGETANWIDEMTGGATAPKTPAQQTMRDVSGILSSILATEGLGVAPAFLDKAGKAGKLAWQALRAGGSTGIHKLGLPEVAEVPLQMIFMGASGNPKFLGQVEAIAKNAYNEASILGKDKNIPEGKWNAPIDQLDIEASVNAPGMGRVKAILQNLKDAINRGGSVDEIKKIKQAANEWKYHHELGEQASRVLNKVIDVTKNGLEEFNMTNPEHGKWWNMGEELHHGLNSHNFITQSLIDATTFDPKNVTLRNVGTKLLFGVPQLITGLSPKTGLYAAGAKAGSYLGKVADLVWQSPIAREHYINAFKAGSAGNAAAVVNHAKQVDKYLEKREKHKVKKVLSKNTW